MTDTVVIGNQVRCYVVSISTANDNPFIFGPYTQRKARELAEAFNAGVDETQFVDDFCHAGAVRIRNPQSVCAMLREFGQ